MTSRRPCSNHYERLDAIGHGRSQERFGRLVREILPAGEEPSGRRRRVTWPRIVSLLRLERVGHGAERDSLKRPQTGRQHDFRSWLQWGLAPS